MRRGEERVRSSSEESGVVRCVHVGLIPCAYSTE